MIAKRLRNKVDGPSLHRFHGHRNIAVAIPIVSGFGTNVI